MLAYNSKINGGVVLYEANERGGIKWNRISKQNINLTKTIEGQGVIVNL